MAEKPLVADFPAFYRDHFTALTRFLVTLGASPDEAQDHAQDGMNAVLLKWGQVEYPQAFARTVAARALWRARGQARREHQVACSGAPEDLVDFVSFEAEAVDVLEQLRSLPPEQREVLAWTVDGYSPREIAQMTGQNPATVRSHLRHGRQLLRRLLDQHHQRVRKEDRDGVRP